MLSWIENQARPLSRNSAASRSLPHSIVCLFLTISLIFIDWPDIVNYFQNFWRWILRFEKLILPQLKFVVDLQFLLKYNLTYVILSNLILCQRVFLTQGVSRYKLRQFNSAFLNNILGSSKMNLCKISPKQNISNKYIHIYIL